MAIETLLVVFVAVAAISVLVQALVIRSTMRSTRETVARLSGASKSLEQDARDIMGQVQEIVAGLEHLKTVFENLANRSEEVNRMVDERTQDLNELVATLIEVGNRQAEKVDEAVTDTVAKFRQTTDIIQQDLLRPIVEISSVIRGLKVGLDYLLGRGATRLGSADRADEEMFI